MFGFLVSSIATSAMASSLFTRRGAKSGWLDELDGIRGEALVAPDGEVAAAMHGTEPIEEHPDQPGSLAEWIDPSGGRASFEAAVAAGAAELEASQPTSSLPPPPDLGPATLVDHPSPGAWANPEASERPIERATVTGLPAPASMRTAAGSYGDLPYAGGTDAPTSPAPEPADHAATPPRLIDVPAPEPIIEPVARVEAAPPPAVLSAPAAPAPHRLHPEQMWHPDVVAAPAEELTTEERLASTELYDEPQAPKFRFARLRPVGADEAADPADLPEVDDHRVPYVPLHEPTPGGLIDGPVARRVRRDPSHPLPGADEGLDVGGQPIPEAVAAPVPTAFAAAPAPVAPAPVEDPAEPAAWAEPAATVAAVEPIAEPAGWDEPAVESASVEDDPAGPRVVAWAGPAAPIPSPPVAAEVEALPPVDLVPPTEPVAVPIPEQAMAVEAPAAMAMPAGPDAPVEPVAEAVAAPVAPVEPAAVAAPIVEPEPIVEPVVEPMAVVDAPVAVEAEPAVDPMAEQDRAPVFGWADPTESVDGARPGVAAVLPEPLLPPAPIEPEPAPAAVPIIEPRFLPVDAEGTVELPEGHLRLGAGAGRHVVLDADGVHLDLAVGWCWAVASAIGAPVRVVTGSRSVRVDAGAVLVSREGDGSTFVAVVDGEASIEGREGAVAVPATSVVLVGVDGSVQVDEAGVEELLADPVLAANLAADDRR